MTVGVPGSFDNNIIGTGKVYFTNDADPTAGEVWLGNVKSFTVTNDVVVKDHYRSWGGMRTKDGSVVTQVGATIDFVADEITKEALTMFALGTMEASTDGSYLITGLTNSRLEGILRCRGDNDNGPQLEWTGRVQLQPSGTLALIQDNDDFNSIPFKASAQQDDTYGLGQWRWFPND